MRNINSKDISSVENKLMLSLIFFSLEVTQAQNLVTVRTFRNSADDFQQMKDSTRLASHNQNEDSPLTRSARDIKVEKERQKNVKYTRRRQKKSGLIHRMNKMGGCFYPCASMQTRTNNVTVNLFLPHKLISTMRSDAQHIRNWRNTRNGISRLHANS